MTEMILRNSLAPKSLLSLLLMKQTARQRIGRRWPAMRRMLVAMLCAIYLVVGFGGEISCADEEGATASSSDIIYSLDGDGAQKSSRVVEHCYTCAPVVMPAPVLVAEPSAEPVKLSFEAPTFVLEDHPGLDTPPPKHLTSKS